MRAHPGHNLNSEWANRAKPGRRGGRYDPPLTVSVSRSVDGVAHAR